MRGQRLNLVTVYHSWHPVQAWLVRNLLADEGVDAVIGDEFVVGMYWLYANAVGGVKVLVPLRQAEHAWEILSQDHHELLPATPDVSADAPRCSHCGSAEVCPERYSRRGMYIAWIFLGFPIPIASEAVRCLSCGGIDHQNEDAEDDSTLREGQYSLKQMMIVMTIVACLCGILRMTLPALFGHEVTPAVERRP